MVAHLGVLHKTNVGNDFRRTEFIPFGTWERNEFRSTLIAQLRETDGMAEIKATNITWHEGHVTREERSGLLKQAGATLWFTGLSGSGKSTIAFTLEHALAQRGRLAYVLDGDNIRHGLNKNLGFSAADREENIRRIGEVAKLFADCGVVTMTSFISPYRKDRDTVRALHQAGKLPFIEVFVNTPIATCEQRDPKGLYKKARAGELKNFTGIDDPYEEPLQPELTIDATNTTPQQATVILLEYLEKRGIVR
jgi:adenylylsulfate kinase